MPLPVINTKVPVTGFFLFAPAILLALYVYLQLYLQRMWDGLASLPAVFYHQSARLAERNFLLRVPDEELDQVLMPDVQPKLCETPGRIAHAGPPLPSCRICRLSPGADLRTTASGAAFQCTPALSL